ncbi:bifunctional protein BirA (plasmid) [Klebsiella oxytoca]|uniref:bifunctional biotin--[acetyl-CoA-carboxylase] ligase/biotin operon repressor BirA n=1 Tax=Klebsiella oxytoca TaxID=571 RepID=UPI000D52A308|nr:bifunctional biotin--[acetyl-CoA-carboxylase] ligase/biotin operon repressor BirA [Klebsiella oxytoca]AWF33384.1 bifunctional protein BirA [Klebsiella oxytoca]
MKDYTIPLTLIHILSDGKFHSGELLGAKLGMSRAAINKHVKTICGWGIDVISIQRKGYRLGQPMQLLNEDKICRELGQRKITVLSVINSTNQFLLDRLPELESGDVCIAEYQHDGRGRRGRKWFSPFGSNLYLSMFWALEEGAPALIGLSLVIGIVIAETLEKLGIDGIRVKWPNDLYLYERKLAGILIEISSKSGEAAKTVIGVGLNLSMQNAPKDEVDQAWISLDEAGIKIDRNVLCAHIIKDLRSSIPLFEKKGLEPFLSRWEERDNFINRPVKLIIGDKEICGIYRGINERGALLLEQDGVITQWLGGEVSLRNID